MNFYKILLLLLITSLFSVSCKNLTYNINTNKYEKLFLDESLNEKFKEKEIGEFLDYLDVGYNKNYSGIIDEPPMILRGWKFYFSVDGKYDYIIMIVTKRQAFKKDWKMAEVKRLKIQSISMTKLPSFK